MESIPFSICGVSVEIASAGIDEPVRLHWSTRIHVDVAHVKVHRMRGDVESDVREVESVWVEVDVDFGGRCGVRSSRRGRGC